MSLTRPRFALFTTAAAVVSMGACSSSKTTATSCGPGTTLVNNQCVVADAAADSVVDSVASDTGSAGETSVHDSVAETVSEASEVNAVDADADVVAETTSDGDAASVPTEFVVVRVDVDGWGPEQGMTFAAHLEKRKVADRSLVATLDAPVTASDGGSQNIISLSGDVGNGALALSADGSSVTFCGHNLVPGTVVEQTNDIPVVASVTASFLTIDTSVTDPRDTATGCYAAVQTGPTLWLAPMYPSTTTLELIGPGSVFASSTSQTVLDVLEMQTLGGQVYGTIYTNAGGAIYLLGAPGGDGGAGSYNGLQGLAPQQAHTQGFALVNVHGSGTAPDRIYYTGMAGAEGMGLQRWDFSNGNWFLTDTLDRSTEYARVAAFVSHRGTTVTVIATTWDGWKKS